MREIVGMSDREFAGNYFCPMSRIVLRKRECLSHERRAYTDKSSESNGGRLRFPVSRHVGRRGFRAAFQSGELALLRFRDQSRRHPDGIDGASGVHEIPVAYDSGLSSPDERP